MLAPLRLFAPFRPPERTTEERRLLDREHDLLNLIIGSVAPAGLSDRREREIIAAGAEAMRRVVQHLDAAVVTASIQDRQEADANEHVRICGWCRRWNDPRYAARYRCCRGFRAISRSIDHAHQLYRRALKRLGRS